MIPPSASRQSPADRSGHAGERGDQTHLPTPRHGARSRSPRSPLATADWTGANLLLIGMLGSGKSRLAAITTRGIDCGCGSETGRLIEISSKRRGPDRPPANLATLAPAISARSIRGGPVWPQMAIVIREFMGMTCFFELRSAPRDSKFMVVPKCLRTRSAGAVASSFILPMDYCPLDSFFHAVRLRGVGFSSPGNCQRTLFQSSPMRLKPTRYLASIWPELR